MTFVVDEAMRGYYEQRASEYDDWWLGTGQFARRDRPGWAEVRGELRLQVPHQEVDAQLRGTGLAVAPGS